MQKSYQSTSSHSAEEISLARMLWTVGVCVCLVVFVSADQGRLPRTVLPKSYRLDINTLFEGKNVTAYGEVWIDVEITKPTQEIVLHSKGLHIIKEDISVKVLTPNNERFVLPSGPSWKTNASVKVQQRNSQNIHESVASSSILAPTLPINGEERPQLHETSSTKPQKFPCNISFATGGSEISTTDDTRLGVITTTPTTPNDDSNARLAFPRQVSGGYTHRDHIKLSNRASTSISDTKGEIQGIVDTITDRSILKNEQISVDKVWSLLYKDQETSSQSSSFEANSQTSGQTVAGINLNQNLQTPSTTSVWELLYKDEVTTTDQTNISSTDSSQNPSTSVETTLSVWDLLYHTPSTSSPLPDHVSNANYNESSTTNQEQTQNSSATFDAWLQLYKPTNLSRIYKNESTGDPSNNNSSPSTSIASSSSLHISTQTSHLHTTTESNDSFESEMVPIDDVSLEKKNDFLILKLQQKLNVGRKYRIHLKFINILTHEMAGYFKIPYRDPATNQTRVMTSSVFEPMDARRAFPCFDEPNLKAKFQLNLIRPKNMTSLSNTQLRKTYSVAGYPDVEVDSYEETPLMSTYLVALHVGNLEYREAVNTSTKKPFRVYARSTALNNMDYILEVGPKFQQFLGNYLQFQDPMNKTDILVLPLFQTDALENWGLISYFDEKSVTYIPGVNSRSTQLRVVTVLAHELSHTWFGNLVTLDWWDDIWLNEGFATYFAGLAVNHVYPEWDVQSLLAIRTFLKVFSIDSLHSSHALVPDTKVNMLHLFDSISYYKGQYILRMVRHIVGEGSFRKGCIRYVKQYAYSNVRHQNFLETMTQQAHEDGTLPSTLHLTKVMREWTRQPGFPVVTVIRDYRSRTAHVVQSRFLRPRHDVESRDGDIEDAVWWIPITYTTQRELNFNDTKPQLWLEPQELITTVKDLPSKDQWIMFNIQAAGFYRVNYDLSNWNLIISYLRTSDYDKISILNRAQLIDDVFNFARVGDVPYGVALNMTKYLKQEHHYLPWMSVLHNFDYVKKMLKSTNTSEEFKKYVQGLLAPEFDRLSFHARSEDTLVESINRHHIIRWACQTGLKGCVQEAITQYNNWINAVDEDETNENPIESDVRTAVYCTAIEHGGEHEWVFLWHRYLDPRQDMDRPNMLAALGCTKDPRILKRYLEMTIRESSGLKKQHLLNVFKAVIRNDLGQNLAKNFFLDKFDDIKAYNGERIKTYFLELLDSLASKMNHESELKELEEFQKKHKENFRDAKYSFQMFSDKVRFNIEWLKLNYATISNWLKSENVMFDKH